MYGVVRLQKLGGQAVIADRTGNVAMLFAIVFMAIMGIVGSAVDYGRAISTQSRAAAALDAAVLAAAEALRNDGKAQATDASALALARATVERYWSANISDIPVEKVVTSIVRDGVDINIFARYDSTVDTTVMSIAGFDTVAIGGTASAVATGFPYIDLTLVVDTSASMALGASEADIDRLRNQFGCAFACHDNPGADSYSWARSNGVKLRYDLIRDAILNLADYLENFNSGGRIQVQLYEFNDKLTQLSPLNASMNNLRKNLPSDPVTSSETVGGTRFWEFASTLPSLVAKSGDGSTRGKATQLLLMLTDGVQDPNRTWTSDVPLRAYVREFDWTACDQIRADGAMIGVVQVPYLKMDWDWGYGETLGQPSLLGRPGMQRIDDVSHALEKCGGDLHMTANSPEQVTNSFQTLFRKAVPIRLTR